jgi:uncharacterized protein (DUF58 family)
VNDPPQTYEASVDALTTTVAGAAVAVTVAVAVVVVVSVGVVVVSSPQAPVNRRTTGKARSREERDRIIAVSTLHERGDDSSRANTLSQPEVPLKQEDTPKAATLSLRTRAPLF